MSCHFFTVFLFYLWFCALSFIQTVKELEHNTCHEDAKLNLQNYGQMKGAKKFAKDEDFAPISDYDRHYNTYVSDSFLTGLNTGGYYSNVIARPEYYD